MPALFRSTLLMAYGDTFFSIFHLEESQRPYASHLGFYAHRDRYCVRLVSSAFKPWLCICAHKYSPLPSTNVQLSLAVKLDHRISVSPMVCFSHKPFLSYVMGMLSDTPISPDFKCPG